MFLFCDDGRAVNEKVMFGDEDRNNMEDTSGYEKSGVHLV